MTKQTKLNPLTIEITNHCNMNCVMCVSHGAALYQGQADEHPSFIEVDFFKSILKQYAKLQEEGPKSILPQFQGEPLLHPQFIELCEAIEEQKMSFGFTTNASALTPSKSKALLKFKHFNEIVFSIDGLTKETYEKIRIGAQYDKVISNIEVFLELAKECNPMPSIAVSFTEQPLNEFEVDDFIRYWLNKVKRVSINNVAFHGRPTKLFWTPERIPCGDLWHFMIVLTNGKVVPCCRDYLYQFDLGHLMKQSLEEVWYGKKYEALRKHHLEGKWNQISLCNDCDTWMSRTEKREIQRMNKKIEITRGPFFRTATRTETLSFGQRIKAFFA